MKNIKVSEILDDLTRGLFRSPKSNGYDSEIGSIQEKYELNDQELKVLFEHKKLKGRKRGQQIVSIQIEDDTEDLESEVKAEVEEVPNNSGLEPGLFDAPWDTEVREARELAKNVTVSKD